jgi:hypothetical protein
MSNDKSLKDRIQDSPVVFFLTAIVASFLAGIGAYKGILEIAHLETISKQDRSTLEQAPEQFQKQLDERNQQIAVLQAKLKSTHAANAAERPTSALTPYMQAVDDFLTAPPLPNYQWEGYRADVDKLDSFVKQFFDYLQQHPTNYADAQGFYAAIDEAASEVNRRAEKFFMLDKEPGTGAERLLNYDQKVFVGPSWFRIRVQELRLRHQQGMLRPEEIEDFRAKFNDWRQTKAGI